MKSSFFKALFVALITNSSWAQNGGISNGPGGNLSSDDSAFNLGLNSGSSSSASALKIPAGADLIVSFFSNAAKKGFKKWVAIETESPQVSSDEIAVLTLASNAKTTTLNRSRTIDFYNPQREEVKFRFEQSTDYVSAEEVKLKDSSNSIRYVNYTSTEKMGIYLQSYSAIAYLLNANFCGYPYGIDPFIRFSIPEKYRKDCGSNLKIDEFNNPLAYLSMHSKAKHFGRIRLDLNTWSFRLDETPGDSELGTSATKRSTNLSNSTEWIPAR